MSAGDATNEVYLTLVYDGEALRDHALKADILSDIYKGIDELIKCANAVLNESGSIDITVEGYAPEGGCLKIPLRFREKIRLVKGFLPFIGENKTIQGITTLLSLIGLISKNIEHFACCAAGITLLSSVIDYYLQVSGRKIEKSEEGTDGNRSIVVDGKAYSVPELVLKLANHEVVRKNTKKILQPLSREGIQTFEVRDKEGQPIREKIRKQEAEPFLQASEQQECLDETVFPMLLSIIKISFKQRNKWEFSDGESHFSAVIKDQGFLNAIDNDKISFSKNSLLRAHVKRSQEIVNNKIQSTYEVTEILEILKER